MGNTNRNRPKYKEGDLLEYWFYPNGVDTEDRMVYMVMKVQRELSKCYMSFDRWRTNPKTRKKMYWRVKQDYIYYLHCLTKEFTYEMTYVSVDARYTKKHCKNGWRKIA